MAPDHPDCRVEPDGPTRVLLDCHDKIRNLSGLLLRLDVQVIHYGIDEAARAAAGEILHYFQTEVPLHHADEQRDLFPLLLSFGNAAVAQALDALKIEHAALGAQWRTVRPWLDSIQRRRPLPRPKALASFATRYPAYADREEREVYWAARALSSMQAQQLLENMTQRREAADPARSAARAPHRTAGAH